MKRNADESDLSLSQFERDTKSLRQQSLESLQEDFLKYSPASVANAEDARRLLTATLFCSSMVRNIVDPIYPGDDDGGEVVAMGTEDTMACGLLKDQDETRLFEYEPTLIPKCKLNMNGGKAVTSVATGGLHSACLHRDGTVSTWGANDENALGRDDIDDDDTHLIKPMKIKDVIQISAGDNHTIVLDIHGKVHVSGMYKDMDSGKWRDLTNPQDTKIRGNHQYPSEVLGLGGKIVMIDAGNSWNAALRDDVSTLYTWGMGNSGQLARSKSMQAPLIDDTYIDSNGKEKCPYKTYELKKPFMGKFVVMMKDGAPLLDHKKKKQFDYEYTHSIIRDKFMTPAPVEWAGGLVPKRQVVNFSCGDIHLLVVARNPGSFETQVFSAGNSAYGQLGHGDTKEVHELTPIEALNNKHISKVAAGNFHSLALSMNRQDVFAWGKIDAGSLGLYDEKKTLKFQQTDYVATPEQVAFPNTLGESCLVDIAAGDTSSFAITDTGAVYSWGYNENSQTGHYNVPGEFGKPDENGNEPTNLIGRPRLLDVIAAVNDGITRSKQTPVAKNCRVTRVSGGGQHSLMVIKRSR